MQIKKHASYILIILMLIVSFTSFTETARAECIGNSSSTADECEELGGTWYDDTDDSSDSDATAVTCDDEGTIGGLICEVHGILGKIIPLLVALGVIYFVWGVVQYVIADESEAKKKGKDKIIYGIIGLAVIIGIWGLVTILVNTFNLGGKTPPPIPQFTTSSSGSGGDSCDDVLGNRPKFQDLLKYAGCIISSSVIPLIFALATLLFFWGVVQYVLNSSDEARKEKGRQFMIWGVIGLAVMFSVWGLVYILGNTFGIDIDYTPQVNEDDD